MAHLLRSAMSGGNWTQHQLEAHNIRVVDVDVAAFFGTSELPPLSQSVSQTVLDNLQAPEPIEQLTKSDRHFFQFLEAAEISEELAVCDFTAFILHMLGYHDEDRIIRRRKEISFYMAGQRVDTTVDVFIMNDLDYFLLFQEDIRHSSTNSDDPVPPLIAEAIAAYYQNDLRRTRTGLPALPTIQVPGITMFGTAPVFYRISVSQQLVRALNSATYPAEETVVLRFVPPVANKQTYINSGMRPLDDRRIVLQCFKAFKSAMHEMQSQTSTPSRR